MDFDKFKNIDISKLMPSYQINTSFVDDMNKRNQELLDSITPLDEILAEQIKPILDGNQKVVDGLSENYNKLNELYKLKENELEASQAEAQKAKSYNTKMLVIALISGVIALASLVTTIIIAALGGAV